MVVEINKCFFLIQKKPFIIENRTEAIFSRCFNLFFESIKGMKCGDSTRIVALCLTGLPCCDTPPPGWNGVSLCAWPQSFWRLATKRCLAARTIMDTIITEHTIRLDFFLSVDLDFFEIEILNKTRQQYFETEIIYFWTTYFFLLTKLNQAMWEVQIFRLNYFSDCGFCLSENKFPQKLKKKVKISFFN